MAFSQGRPLTMEKHERIRFIGPAGVMATACKHRSPDATREAPAVIAVRINRQLREGQVGPSGVTERLVIPTKPGNSGGGKEPQLKTNAGSYDGHGD